MSYKYRDFKFEIGDRVRSNITDVGEMIIHDRRSGPVEFDDRSMNQYDMVHENGHKDHAGWFEYGLTLVSTIAEEYAMAVQYLGEEYFA